MKADSKDNSKSNNKGVTKKQRKPCKANDKPERTENYNEVEHVKKAIYIMKAKKNQK